MTFDPERATIIHTPRPKAKLIVKQGPQIGILFPITAERLILGREETCNIIIQDAEASRRHCELAWDEATGDYFLQDLGSTNGTFINGVQVSAPTPLKSGNSIGIGQTTLVLELENGGLATQVGYEFSAGAQGDSDAQAGVDESARGGTKKWLAFGCGCLILLCACGAIGLIGLDLTDFLDLGIPGLSDLQLSF